MLQTFRQKRELNNFKCSLESIESEKTKNFLTNNWFTDNSQYRLKIDKENDEASNIKKITSKRDTSTIKLKLKPPHTLMLKEARALRNHFIPHRKDPSFGWESLCLHGIDGHKTEHFTEYGFSERPVDKFHWTDFSQQCPVTTKWFKEVFPYSVYFRVRFMLLKPGGFITPHNDLGGDRGFAAINIALNQPFGCMMFMENFGLVPWRPGDVRLMDIGINHCVVNLSNEDRYHIIVHGYAGHEKRKEYNKVLINSV